MHSVDDGHGHGSRRKDYVTGGVYLHRKNDALWNSRRDFGAVAEGKVNFNLINNNNNNNKDFISHTDDWYSV